VDAFARRRLELLGEQTYTVTTPTKKFRWMVWIEQQAQIAGEASFAARARNTLNFISDTAQVARAHTIYQNTWDWQGSPYTISEMTQTWLWGTIGRKRVIRFSEPWE
jgi:hypothetical protein